MLKIPIFIIISGIWLYAATETDSSINIDTVSSAVVISDSTDSTEALNNDSAIKKSTLVISTEPSEAIVILDDSVRGLSPLIISNVDTGLHSIALKKKGCYLKKAEVRIDSSQKKEFHFILQQPSRLYITTEPSGASLIINKKSVGKTPYFNKLIKPGEYVVIAEMENYQRIEQTHVVQSNISDTLKLTLKHSATYLDSVKTSETQAKKAQKLLTGIIVGGAFALFGIVLLIIEARE